MSENLIRNKNTYLLSMNGKEFCEVKSGKIETIDKYEYNTRYPNKYFAENLKQYGASFEIDMSKPIDTEKLFGIDNTKFPNKCDLQIIQPIPCRRHKKKRINKKWTKKYGQKYIQVQKIVKGWKMNHYTNGEFEFVKDGDEL